MAACLSLSLTNERREIARAAAAIETFGRDQALSTDDVSAVNLALDEILANIISHAYDDQSRHAIHLRVIADDRAIEVLVEDDGKPFNPLKWPPPNLDVPLERRPVGGLGLHIARSVVETIDYRREAKKNVLTIVRLRRDT